MTKFTFALRLVDLFDSIIHELYKPDGTAPDRDAIARSINSFMYNILQPYTKEENNG